MEQQPLFNSVNMVLPILNDTIGVPANSTVILSRLTVFLCPSAPPTSYLGTGLAAGPLSSFRFRATAISARWGRAWSTTFQTAEAPPTASSTTAAVEHSTGSARGGHGRVVQHDRLRRMEARHRQHRGRHDPAGCHLRRDGLPHLEHDGHGDVDGRVRKVPDMDRVVRRRRSPATASTRGPRSVTLGQYWAAGLPILTLGNTVLGPNPKIPNCGFTNSYNSGGMFTLSSYRPGGTNVVMGDGSVRFLKDSISLTTIWALGSRAQGEVVSADSY